MKKLFVLLSIISAFATVGCAQRASVSGAEVTGTFRSYFTGKFKGNYNEVKITALGGGKLRVGLDLTYPYVMSGGGLMANVGQADGTAQIVGDTAVFSPPGTDDCKITIKFVKKGQIKIKEESSGAGCGFGLNVYSDGTYTKISGKKPKFESL